MIHACKVKEERGQGNCKKGRRGRRREKIAHAGLPLISVLAMRLAWTGLLTLFTYSLRVLTHTPSALRSIALNFLLFLFPFFKSSRLLQPHCRSSFSPSCFSSSLIIQLELIFQAWLQNIPGSHRFGAIRHLMLWVNAYFWGVDCWLDLSSNKICLALGNFNRPFSVFYSIVWPNNNSINQHK